MESFKRGYVRRIGLHQEWFAAAGEWLEHLDKIWDLHPKYLKRHTSVNLKPLLHSKSNPCLNARISGWFGGSDPTTMCCGGRNEHLSSLLQGLAEPLVICPPSRRYWIKVLWAIKTLTKIEHWACSRLRGLVQLVWSVASVRCIMVSQRRSRNTKNAKMEGHWVLPRYQAHQRGTKLQE